MPGPSTHDVETTAKRNRQLASADGRAAGATALGSDGRGRERRAYVASRGECFGKRGRFAEQYLLSRLRLDTAWRDDPSQAFQQVRRLLADARGRWFGVGEQVLRQRLYAPLFELLGFQATLVRRAGDAHTEPDVLLSAAWGRTAAFVYAWDRWLDGPDFDLDRQSPEVNPGACVVAALEEGVADWIIVTNGRQWRLYSRHARCRASDFYEVDLVEALAASDGDGPNEAFRYWWLFFRAAAFAPIAGEGQGCWLDTIARQSRETMKDTGERLKQRVVETIFRQLAQGFLDDRKHRLGIRRQPSDDDLRDVHDATLTLLYRLMFLLYAESRDLLPIREATYRAASLSQIKEEIAERAGNSESEAADCLAKEYSTAEVALYDRLSRLFEALDRGDPSLNVPKYYGGLFNTRPGSSDSREERVARFLLEHKVADRFLASAIDRLAREFDGRASSLEFIDYKSLEVRHLGSIYEGLLELKLRVADEDLATKAQKGRQKFVPLTAVKAKRGKAAVPTVRRGEVYLANERTDRKTSGSYYTPDPIVEYIVEQTVGPALADKLEKLRGELHQVRRTFESELDGLEAPPAPEPVRSGLMAVRDLAADRTYEVHRQLVEQIFDFRVLDPAMGSGHFLVAAVSFITDRLLTFLSRFPLNPIRFMLARARQEILGSLAEQGALIDPDKLTEANLLKRHVLKRCIHGVDLNPMAVELAKISLWLDASAIGAPLSLLDHHLRCGNSLVGATFKDLEGWLRAPRKRSASVFGSIDYEPLLRALRQVIEGNQLPDATAAEVQQSGNLYDGARPERSGYQVVLDLLVARHFALPKAAALLQRGRDLELSSREGFLESLADDRERGLAQRAEALARQAAFFHWEVEFPEVFFRVAGADGRRIMHKDEIAAGSAGFDAVIGNPPYTGHKGDFDPTPLTTFYEVCRKYPNPATAFLERGLLALRGGGRLGMIVPKSIQYVESWEASRRLLAESNHLVGIADVSQAFDDVLLEQTVCLAARQPAVDGYFAGVFAEDGRFSGRRIESRIAAQLGCFPAQVDERSLRLLRRLLEAGPLLGEIANTSQALGYQAHLNKDVTGERVPIYRGKQIRPMRIEPPSDFIDRSFLLGAGDELTPKIKEMLRPKVVSQNIVAHVTRPKPRVWIISAPDHEGILCLNTISTTILRDEGFSVDFIAAVLNSTLAAWFYTEFAFCRAIRTMHFDNYYAGKLPIAAAPSSAQQPFGELARRTDACVTRGKRQRAIDNPVFDAYGLTRDERRFLYEFCYGTDQIEAVLTGF